MKQNITKKIVFSILAFSFAFCIFAESSIPAVRRPKKGDPELVKEANLRDDNVNEKKDTIRFGLESEIVELVDKLILNNDPRFSDDLYDVFQTTKSTLIKESIIKYFTKFEDPCLASFAVTILDDPFDEKNSTVDLLFKYVAAIKCEEARNACMELLESENDSYFNGALLALGEIGGEEEATFLIEYLDREDLTVPQKQALMKVLGKLNATSIWDKLVEIAEDENENSFVRMYAAKAIGDMKKEESVSVLIKLFEDADPNFRTYIIQGLSNFKGNKDAENTIIQGIRDSHYKVRLESLNAVSEMNLVDAIPFVIHRARNDSEKNVKYKAYEILAKMDNTTCNEFLIELITDRKANDEQKIRSSEALIKYGKAGRKEIAELAITCATDDRRKPLRYSLGKLIASKAYPEFSKVCSVYLASKDAATCAVGLDMYALARYAENEKIVSEMAENSKAGNNQTKARKILKLD